MPAYCYILYSNDLGKFYIGTTTLNPEQRPQYHLEKRYGAKAFTASTDDWELFHFIECEELLQARKIESHLKSMKSKQYIRNLIKYPEISDKLKLRYLV